MGEWRKWGRYLYWPMTRHVAERTRKEGMPVRIMEVVENGRQAWEVQYFQDTEPLRRATNLPCMCGLCAAS